MPKQSFDDKLDRLRAVASGPLSDDGMETLREALAGKSAVLAALAAEIIGEARIVDLTPELVLAFDRFMVGTDKQCQAKTAIVDALNKLDSYADEVYLRGVRHVQMEPSFGGMVDTADNLRASSAVGLANMGHREAPYELTTLLADKLPNPRKAAVKALAYLGGIEAELLIRLKALVGDTDAGVMGECFTALMSIAPDRSMSFVGEFLASPDLVIAEQAALALGQSHQPEAFDVMREQWEKNISPEFRYILLLPIALLRKDEAFEFLMDVVGNSGPRLAAAAVTALGMYADDNSRRRIRGAVERRHESVISDAYNREFGRTD